MQANIFTCTRYVGDKIMCWYCNENCIKHAGFQGNNVRGVTVVKKLQTDVVDSPAAKPSAQTPNIGSLF